MNKEWSSDQLKLLKNLSETFQGKRWKKISKEFQAHGYYRSEYECRNKWVNYLNPDIDHREWTQQELRTLYDEYQKHKSQWALIQKALPTRTQIKIRNQFYGAIRNLVRFLIKYFKDVGSSWSLISNKIRPEVLQNLYSGEKDFSFVGGIVKDAIFQMEFRFDRIKFMEIIQLNQEVFKKANNLILQSLQNLQELLQNDKKQEHKKPQEESPVVPTQPKMQVSQPMMSSYMKTEYEGFHASRNFQYPPTYSMGYEPYPYQMPYPQYNYMPPYPPYPPGCPYPAASYWQPPFMPKQ